MGLGNNNSAIYLSIADGKVVRRFKEPTKNSVTRRLAKGPNAGKEVHEEFYDFIEGWITKIFVKKGDYGKTWNVTMSDGGTEYILQMDYSSGYSSAFLKTLPNVDFSLQVKIQPEMKVENDKKKASMFVKQKGSALKWYFTKENPNGLPQMRQLVVKGENVWDDTDMMLFLERMVEDHILPQLGTVASDDSTTSHINDDTRDAINSFVPGDEPQPSDDDLPF